MLDKQLKVLVQFIMACHDVNDRNPKDVTHSLTFFRAISLYRELQWIADCISQNAYHQSIREMRFVLDSMVQAYYIDERHRDSQMPCKLEIVKEIEEWGFGRRLIDKTNLCHKSDLKNLYGELSAYSHSTCKELVSSRSRKAKEIASLTFEEDIEMKNLCIEFLNRMLDAVLFVTLSLFPEILGPQTKLRKIKASLPISFKQLGFKLALNKLQPVQT